MRFPIASTSSYNRRMSNLDRSLRPFGNSGSQRCEWRCLHRPSHRPRNQVPTPKPAHRRRPRSSIGSSRHPSAKRQSKGTADWKPEDLQVPLRSSHGQRMTSLNGWRHNVKQICSRARNRGSRHHAALTGSLSKAGTWSGPEATARRSILLVCAGGCDSRLQARSLAAAACPTSIARCTHPNTLAPHNPRGGA